jgi:tRNA-Thr(GGU) m(6)t(6)A37 methyltransferase TsaA
MRVKPIGRVVEAGNNTARIEIHERYAEALDGIEDFSHLIILYWFHERDDRKNRKVLKVRPRGSEKIVGVFASRSPSRPNPIGICVVEYEGRDGNIIKVRGLDAIEGSPVLDIKPYQPSTDSFPLAKE